MHLIKFLYSSKHAKLDKKGLMSYDEQLRTNSLLQMINETLRYTILRNYVKKLQF